MMPTLLLMGSMGHDVMGSHKQMYVEADKFWSDAAL
jgi:hypothetical protein